METERNQKDDQQVMTVPKAVKGFSSPINCDVGNNETKHHDYASNGSRLLQQEAPTSSNTIGNRTKLVAKQPIVSLALDVREQSKFEINQA